MLFDGAIANILYAISSKKENTALPLLKSYTGLLLYAEWKENRMKTDRDLGQEEDRLKGVVEEEPS